MSYINKLEVYARAKEEGQFIVSKNATVRAASKVFSISKSTIHRDITKVLEYNNDPLALEVRKVLDQNTKERATRGAQATKRKFLERKNLK